MYICIYNHAHAIVICNLRTFSDVIGQHRGSNGVCLSSLEFPPGLTKMLFGTLEDHMGINSNAPELTSMLYDKLGVHMGLCCDYMFC